jgi:hypothetical protein
VKKSVLGGAAVAGLCAAFALAPATSADQSSLKRGGGADCADFSSQAAAQNYSLKCDL